VASDLMAEGFSVSMTQEDVDEIEAVGAPLPPPSSRGINVPMPVLASAPGRAST
jgi:hypothetical protein